MEAYLRIGVVTSTHGIRGEARVFPTTQDPERFRDLKEVILDTGRERRILPVEGVRFQKNMVLLKFAGIDTPEEMALYRNGDLLVPRDQGIPLEEGEYYVADLLGLSVYAQGELLGRLKEVLPTGANDVYVVESDTYGEVLIPAIRQCILEVDLDRGRMEVRLLEGLLEGGRA